MILKHSYDYKLLYHRYECNEIRKLSTKYSNIQQLRQHENIN